MSDPSLVGLAPARTGEPAGLAWWEMFALHGLLDEERRPLGEHRAPRELTGAAPTRLRRCPYPGSRHQHELPMNASALRQASQHWDGVLAGIAFLHDAEAGRSTHLGLAGLWRLLAAISVLPAYLVHRAGAPAGWRPPGTVAAIYKASLGVKFLLESHLLGELLAGRDVDRPADVDRLAALSEDSGALVGVAEVCAAPANLIAETLRALVCGGDAGRSDLGALVGPWAPFVDFAGAARDLHGALLAYSTLSARIALALDEVLRGLPATARESRPDMPADAAPRAEEPPLEVSLSLTLGMRRLRWPLAALGEARCHEVLRAFGRAATCGDEGSAAAMVALGRDPTAVRARFGLAAALERRLEPLLPGRGSIAAALLARQVELDDGARALVDRADQRLARALGRTAGDGAGLGGYLAASPWRLASRALGVELAHEPGGPLLCAGAEVVAGPGGPLLSGADVAAGPQRDPARQPEPAGAARS